MVKYADLMSSLQSCAADGAGSALVRPATTDVEIKLAVEHKGYCSVVRSSVFPVSFICLCVMVIQSVLMRFEL